MNLLMTKAQAAKLDFSLNCKEMFGRELGQPIADALANYFRSGLTNEDECFKIYVINGRLELILGPLFGIGTEQDDGSPFLIIPLIEVIRNELEMGLWFTREGERGDPLLHVRGLRADLQECIDLIDRLEKAIAAKVS